MKKTTRTIKSLTSLKYRLRKTLPEKIIKILNSYENFSEQDVPDDAKGFTAHHGACKAAIVHAETLLKLAKLADYDPSPKKDPDNELTAILEEAREEEHRDDDPEE